MKPYCYLVTLLPSNIETYSKDLSLSNPHSNILVLVVPRCNSSITVKSLLYVNIMSKTHFLLHAVV